MAEELSIEGKTYVSSKRASADSGYTQDYIGQLARSGAIDAKRVGGLWYISMDSLNAHKSADVQKSEAPRAASPKADVDAVISFDGKDYISASRAAELTSYHQDYVGQLARSGKILSRQIGNRWYVDRAALLAHKEEKDALLASVQSQAVGLRKEGVHVQGMSRTTGTSPFFTYTSDNGALMPALPERPAADRDEETTVPIRIVSTRPVAPHAMPSIHSMPTQPKIRPTKRVLIPRKTIFYGLFSGLGLTVAVLLVFAVFTPRGHALYAALVPHGSGLSAALPASASAVATSIGDRLERYLTPELTYKRTQ